jgi:hypothetical protein
MKHGQKLGDFIDEFGDVVVTESPPAGGGVDFVTLPDGSTVDRVAGTVTLANGTLYGATGNSVTLPDCSVVDKSAGIVTLPDGTQYGNPDTTSILSGIFTPAQIAALKNQMAQRLGIAAGRVVARVIGGNTVLYTTPAGGLQTLNIQSLLIPAALIAGLIALG